MNEWCLNKVWKISLSTLYQHLKVETENFLFSLGERLRRSYGQFNILKWPQPNPYQFQAPNEFVLCLTTIKISLDWMDISSFRFLDQGLLKSSQKLLSLFGSKFSSMIGERWFDDSLLKSVIVMWNVNIPFGLS